MMLPTLKIVTLAPLLLRSTRFLHPTLLGALAFPQGAQKLPPLPPPEPENSSSFASGDKIRSAAGNRPSLHPLTINAIADVLRLRSIEYCGSVGVSSHGVSSDAKGKESNLPTVDVTAEGVEPLDVALGAGRIVSDALARRQVACNADDSSDDDMFNQVECQTIAGRVVGVVMRLPELEEELLRKVCSVPWVKKYAEHSIFGVSKAECDNGTFGERGGKETKMGASTDVMVELLSNPLLRMNRAECILAIFLDTVEKPKLAMVQEDVPGGSECDFIDSDRLEVIRGT